MPQFHVTGRKKKKKKECVPSAPSKKKKRSANGWCRRKKREKDPLNPPSVHVDLCVEVTRRGGDLQLAGDSDYSSTADGCPAEANKERDLSQDAMRGL